jgi:uncharacterized damage-inducible protein DinB
MTYYSAKDLARSFRTVRNNTLQIAHDVPENQYAFRVTPDTRSIGEILAHIAGLSGWQQQLNGVDKKTFVAFDDFGAYISAATSFEATLVSKADIIQALESEGRKFESFLASLSEASLGETVSFPPQADPSSKSRFEMLMGVKEHEMHHRGQLMTMQRLIGLVPHLTQRRQARQQQTASVSS